MEFNDRSGVGSGKAAIFCDRGQGAVPLSGSRVGPAHGRSWVDFCRRYFHLNRGSAIFQIGNVELEASELLVCCQLRRDPRCHKSLFEDFAVW